MTPSAFRASLAELRWSQRSLARLLGVSQTVVHRWGQDERHVIPAVVADWLKHLVLAHRSLPPPQYQPGEWG